MSVNEVKLAKAAKPLEIRGTGPATSRTFCIGDEDHTLGNALRHILMQNSKVNFCGYSVPHPSEPVVHIRIQTRTAAGANGSDTTASEDYVPITACEALKEGCQTLYDQCDILLQKLEEILPEVAEDRERLEKILLEEGFMDEDDDEGEGEEQQQNQDEEEAGDFHEEMDMLH